MARLPNTEHALLDLRKLEEYCLSPFHPRGRHKARVFREVLGLSQADAGWLRSVLLTGIRQYDAIEVATDSLGKRWRVDVPLTRLGRSVMIRTIWIVRADEQSPRFVTCWVL